jgi:hypothetical protein
MLACSSSTPSDNANGDPGKPPSTYGPKCAADLIEEASNATLHFEDCTAAAGVISAGGAEQVSHVFLIFNRLPQEARRMYVSLVVDTVPLVAGTHGSARAGAVEATLEDGRSFSAGDVRKEGAFHFVIAKAGTDGIDKSVFYVTGSLEANLQNPHDTSSKARFRAQINTPDSLATD